MKSPYLKQYRNVEFVQYISQVIDTVNKQDVKALLLTEPLHKLSEVFTVLENRYTQKRGSSITAEIVAIDRKRDNALRGFRMILKAYTGSDNMSEVLLANQLLSIINSYGKAISRKSYNEQTRIINAIITEVEERPELMDAVMLFNVDVWFEKLKQVNIAFNAKYLERVDETAANPRVSFSELRKMASSAFRVLVKHIDAHLTLTNNVRYSELLEKIGKLSVSYNLVVDNRSKSSLTDVSNTKIHNPKASDGNLKNNDDAQEVDNKTRSDSEDVTAITDTSSPRLLKERLNRQVKRRIIKSEQLVSSTS